MIMSKIHQLIYFSQGTRQLSEIELKSMLNISRNNNTRQQVTGILVALDNCFLQLLEGDKTTITRLFEKIKTDDRHTDVLTLHKGVVENRNFPDWSMGFQVTSLETFKREIGFIDISNRQLFIENHLRKANAKVIRLIKRFYYK